MEHLGTKMTLISARNKIQEHMIKIREGGQREQFPLSSLHWLLVDELIA